MEQDAGDAAATIVQESVDRADVARFAEAAADDNPIHLDDDFARAAGQPEAIVHGMLTLARVVEVALARFGPDAFAESLDVRFGAPFPVGRPLHVHTLVEGRDADGAARVAIEGGDGNGTSYVEGELRVVVGR